MNESENNTAAIHHYKKIHKMALVLCHFQYLNTLVEQAQRVGKRSRHCRLGFTSVWAACCTSTGA
jgi:hypothetical protein